MDFKLDNFCEHIDYINSHAVSFTTAYGADWKDHFTTKDSIRNLFQQIRITNEEIIDINQVPNDSPDRATILVTTRHRETGILRKAIIDFTTGDPKWEQFIDLTYDSGANTDLKIIVYDGVWIKPESAGTPPEIADLAAINNRCGVRTLLVETVCSLKEGEKGLEYFLYGDLYSDPEDSILPEIETLPTKRQIQEAEFWAGYYGGHCQYQGAPPIEVDADVINGWTPGFEVTPDVKLRALWTDQGFSMNLLAKPESEKLSEIWDEGKAVLMKEYPGHNIEYSPNLNGRAVISVNLEKTPISELIDMHFEDKWNSAELVYFEEGGFQGIVEGIIRTIDEKNRKH